MNVKIINIALSIFYLSRGITLTEIFYLSIIWGITNIVFDEKLEQVADVLIESYRPSPKQVLISPNLSRGPPAYLS